MNRVEFSDITKETSQALLEMGLENWLTKLKKVKKRSDGIELTLNMPIDELKEELVSVIEELKRHASDGDEIIIVPTMRWTKRLREKYPEKTKELECPEEKREEREEIDYVAFHKSSPVVAYILSKEAPVAKKVEIPQFCTLTDYQLENYLAGITKEGDTVLVGNWVYKRDKQGLRIVCGKKRGRR